MFRGICFIVLGLALLLGGLALMGSADSRMDEILGAVICIAAWALAVWGIICYRLSAIGKAFSAAQASHEARGKYKTDTTDPQLQTKAPAATSAHSPRTPAP